MLPVLCCCGCFLWGCGAHNLSDVCRFPRDKLELQFSPLRANASLQDHCAQLRVFLQQQQHLQTPVRINGLQL